MKRLVVILFAWFFTATAFSQSEVEIWLEVDDAYQFAKSEISIPLPFIPHRRDRYRHYFSVPHEEVSFRKAIKDEDIELPIVKDLQLISIHAIYKPKFDATWGWGISGQLPTAPDSKFVVLLTGTSSGPLSTGGFVSIDSNNRAIDRLITVTEGPTMIGYAHFREFTVDTDTVITVYTVRSIEPGSTLFWDVKGNSFRGQRTDVRYKVSSEGRFVELGKVVYRPQLYKLSTLANLKLNIRDGREKPLIEVGKN